MPCPQFLCWVLKPTGRTNECIVVCQQCGCLPGCLPGCYQLVDTQLLWLGLRSDYQVWSMLNIWASRASLFALAAPSPSNMPAWYPPWLDPWRLSLKYRSVPLIRPPHFVHYIPPKVGGGGGGGGLYSRMQLVSTISPPYEINAFHYQLTMVTTFRIESTVRGHHVYKAAWSPYIGEELPVQRKVNNIHDDFAVAVLKNGNTVGHVSTTGNFQSLLVFLAQEWQQDDLHRQWWQKTFWSWWERTRGSVRIHLQRETKTPWQTDKPVC